MKQFIGLILFLTIFSIVNNKLMTTKTKWVNDLITLAKSNSEYRNYWPYNVLYYDGNKWYADCSNLNKALFNGRDINDKTPGSYQHSLSNTGDVTPKGLFDLCLEKSSNFKGLRSGEPRLLYMDGHIGAYLGKEITVSKGVVNVVEATAAWESKILFSYVDSDGTRRYAKGSSNTRGKWLQHAKPSKWVDYSR